jgi:hypothetical protein
LTSKKYPPHVECPISHEHVQYPDGFSKLYHRPIPAANIPIQYPDRLSSYTHFPSNALVPIFTLNIKFIDFFHMGEWGRIFENLFTGWDGIGLEDIL